eukprot:2183374-Ditylum_brightwellii.AAC.1
MLGRRHFPRSKVGPMGTIPKKKFANVEDFSALENSFLTPWKCCAIRSFKEFCVMPIYTKPQHLH